MVLPLIPAALIAVGALTGGSGVVLGGKGALDIKKARDELNQSAARYERRREQFEQRVAETNDRLASFGGLQEQALIDVVVRMAEFLRRHEKQVRENERLLVDGIDVTMNLVTGPGGVDLNVGAWVAGVFGAAGVAAGASAGVAGVASAVGTAGTGAAISGLSGVAAKSATMAWLGGGSLASGGGGMALGATALNVVTAGPALLIGGFVVMGQGQRALTKAKENIAQIAVAIAEMDQSEAGLDGIDSRAAEVRTVLGDLTSRAVDALDELESEPFEPQAHAARFQRALTLTVAVRDVAAAQILDESGELTDESASLIVKYRPLVEESNE